MHLLERNINGHWKGLIALAQPRTGSTSVARALERVGAVAIGGHHEYTDLALEREYIVLTGVRDHASAFRSFYGRAIKFKEISSDTTPEQYWKTWRLRSVWVRGQQLYWRYLPLATIVYRYESIHGDLAELCDQSALPRLKLPHTKRTSDQTSELAPGLTHEINHYFRDERARLGYN